MRSSDQHASPTTQTAISGCSDAAEEQDAEEKQAFVEALVAEEEQAAEPAAMTPLAAWDSQGLWASPTAVTPAPAALAYHT